MIDRQSTRELKMDFIKSDSAETEANAFYQNFDEKFSITSQSVLKLLEQNQPYKALENLLLFVGTANSYIQTKTNIINKLTGIISQLKMLLQNIANMIKAASYSISVSAPFGISISITWNV